METAVKTVKEFEEMVSRLGSVKAEGVIEGVASGSMCWRQSDLEVHAETGRLLLGKLWLRDEPDSSEVHVIEDGNTLRVKYAPMWFFHYNFRINPTKDTKMRGSLHSHGCWTDYRNPNERKSFSFSLRKFIDLCHESGRDFQAMTDIMAARPGMPEFREHRYDALLRTADAKADYELFQGDIESVVYFEGGKKRVIIPRSQEVLTDIPFKHILALGVSEDVPGGKPAKDTLKRIKGEGGYTVIDHPFMCNAWTEEELLELREEGLVDALEWNGGLTFPAFMYLGGKLKVPSKGANNRVLKLDDRIPVVANDDAHCRDDILRGASSVYEVEACSDWQDNLLVDRVFDAIEGRKFKRNEKYSALSSPLRHVKYGKQAQEMFGQHGLPSA